MTSRGCWYRKGRARHFRRHGRKTNESPREISRADRKCSALKMPAALLDPLTLGHLASSEIDATTANARDSACRRRDRVILEDVPQADGY
jgi:hypothetical protein